MTRTIPKPRADMIWKKWMEFNSRRSIEMARTPIDDDMDLKLVDGIHKGFAIETGDGHTEPVLAMFWTLSVERAEFLVFRTAGEFLTYMVVPEAVE